MTTVYCKDERCKNYKLGFCVAAKVEIRGQGSTWVCDSFHDHIEYKDDEFDALQAQTLKVPA